MNTDFETAGAPPRARRLRRSAAVLAATALLTGALPLSQAQAAPTAVAALTADGQKVLAGSTEALTVNVTNSGVRLLGETVNWVQVKLPNTAGFTSTTGTLSAPDGWTATRDTVVGGINTYTFRGGSLGPGASGAFTFPAAVARPNADRTGVLEVAVSSDNGRTTSGAGSASTLSSLVQTLQIVPDSFKAIAPSGVTDGTATAGQDIDYQFAVRNLAKAAQTVTPTLSSPDSSDKITQAPAASIPAESVGTFTSDVLLGGAGGRIFNAAAVASPSVADGVGSPVYNVLAAVGLDVLPEFSPTASRGDVTLPVTVKVNKTGLQSAVTSAKLDIMLDGGQALVSKTVTGISLPAGNASALPVTFPSVVLGSLAAPLANGVYDARLTFTGTDDNGAPVSYTETLTDVLTIDNDLPDIIRLDITLPNDADGARQTAVSNMNDVVSISGELAAPDCGATVQALTIKAGAKSATVQPRQNGCTFTSSFTTGRGNTIEFDPGTTGFSVTAQAKDAAGNTGSEVSSGLVDIVAPVISSATTKSSDPSASTANRIEVQFFDTVPVLGGCTPSQWEVDGELLITSVQFSDGTPCDNGVARPDNKRVLVLNGNRDQGLQTNVTYTPGTRPFARPVKDGAGQDALEQVIATVSGVNPAAALLRTVTRNNGTETATLDGAYYTRFTGNDLQVNFLNGRANYVVDVLDGNGGTLASKTLASPAADGTHMVQVPIGSTDGSYARALRLRIPKGDPATTSDDLKSALTSFTVVLDRVAPTVANVAKTGEKQATVTFKEVLTGSGTDFAEDWFVTERNSQQDPDDPNDDVAYYQVGSVTGSGATRVLNTNSTLADLGAIGAAYNLRNPDSARYEDRAGNPLANFGA